MGSLKGAIQGAISVLLSLLLLPITLGAVNTLTAVDTSGDSVLGLDSSTLQILSILPIVLVAGAIFLVIRTSWADKSKDK